MPGRHQRSSEDGSDWTVELATRQPMSLADLVEAMGCSKSVSLEGESAYYENQDTGVYFEIRKTAADDRPNLLIPLTAPSFFAREAAEALASIPSLTWSVEECAHEPVETLVHSWRQARATEAVTEVLFAVDAERLGTCWRWNKKRADLAARLTGHHVPRLQFVRHDDRAQTAIIWPDARSIVIPQCELLLLERRELALGRWFKKEDVAIVATGESGLDWDACRSDRGDYVVSDDDPIARALFRNTPFAPKRPHWLMEDRLVDADLASSGQ